LADDCVGVAVERTRIVALADDCAEVVVERTRIVALADDCAEVAVERATIVALADDCAEVAVERATIVALADDCAEVAVERATIPADWWRLGPAAVSARGGGGWRGAALVEDAGAAEARAHHTSQFEPSLHRLRPRSPRGLRRGTSQAVGVVKRALPAEPR